MLLGNLSHQDTDIKADKGRLSSHIFMNHMDVQRAFSSTSSQDSNSQFSFNYNSNTSEGKSTPSIENSNL